MTERLYYGDSYLTSFSARVVDTAGPLRVYLDRTAFYPDSGGQPADHGLLNDSRVLDVVDEGDRIAHLLETPLATGEVSGSIAWSRRFDHMQQHSGQHLLSAVLADHHQLRTVSFHLGAGTSTIDIESRALEPARLRALEEEVNAVVLRNLPIGVSFEDSSVNHTLRKQSSREGTLRIVTIQDLDRSACGGTHVRSTAEIGPIFLLGTEKVRSTLRIEFVCGLRAIRRLRSDLDTATAGLTQQIERTGAAEKARLKTAVELARYRGREARQAASHLLRTGVIDDEARTFAQAFTSTPGAVLLQVCNEPPSFLLAVSPDTGFNAGALIKDTLAAHGGRGGGSPLIAQAGLPDRAGLDAAIASLTVRLGLQLQ